MNNDASNNTQDPAKKNTDKPDNNPDQAMDTPEEVERSNDPNIEKDFPGYPHYPAKDDILDPDNNNGKVDVDLENLSSGGRNLRTEMNNEAQQPADNTVNAPFDEVVENDEDNDDLGIVAGTDADVTAEDLLLLGSKDQDMDMGEDEEIPSVSSLLDKAGYELDTPGSELDDASESIGEEDEENNYYSIGGDRHEDLEEDTKNNY